MDEKKKLALLEDVMALKAGKLSSNMFLEQIDEYDSMARLQLMMMMNDEFGKNLTDSQIKSFKTVQDILDIMN